MTGLYNQVVTLRPIPANWLQQARFLPFFQSLQGVRNWRMQTSRTMEGNRRETDSPGSARPACASTRASTLTRRCRGRGACRPSPTRGAPFRSVGPYAGRDVSDADGTLGPRRAGGPPRGPHAKGLGREERRRRAAHPLHPRQAPPQAGVETATTPSSSSANRGSAARRGGGGRKPAIRDRMDASCSRILAVPSAKGCSTQGRSPRLIGRASHSTLPAGRTQWATMPPS